MEFHTFHTKARHPDGAMSYGIELRRAADYQPCVVILYGKIYYDGNPLTARHVECMPELKEAFLVAQAVVECERVGRENER